MYVHEWSGNPVEKIMNKMVNNDVATRSRASEGLRTPPHSANWPQSRPLFFHSPKDLFQIDNYLFEYEF